MFRLLAAVMLCTIYAVHTGDHDLIQWSNTRRLSWNDFVAAPPEHAYNAALTCTSIEMRFTYNGEALDYVISCNFDKNSSWGRIKNDYILAHEQAHFDIAEMYARRLHQAIKDYTVNEKTVGRDMNALYKKTMDELQQMQKQYDDETDHSRNVPQQKLWLVKIGNMLDALPSYPDKQAGVK